jgi:hypothetical protein
MPVDPLFLHGVPKGIPFTSFRASSLPCRGTERSHKPLETIKNKNGRHKAGRFYSYGVPKGRVILRVYNLSSLFYWDKSITLPPKKSTK